MRDPDRYLREKVFQQWSDWCHEQLNTTCYFLGFISGVVAVVGMNICAPFWAYETLQQRLLTAALVSVFMIYVETILFRADRTYVRTHSLVRLPLFLTSPILRLSFVAYTVINIVFLVSAFVSVGSRIDVDLMDAIVILAMLFWTNGTVCMLYFAACIPRPPRRTAPANAVFH